MQDVGVLIIELGKVDQPSKKVLLEVDLVEKYLLVYVAKVGITSRKSGTYLLSFSFHYNHLNPSCCVYTKLHHSLRTSSPCYCVQRTLIATLLVLEDANYAIVSIAHRSGVYFRNSCSYKIESCKDTYGHHHKQAPSTPSSESNSPVAQ